MHIRNIKKEISKNNFLKVSEYLIKQTFLNCEDNLYFQRILKLRYN
jgi:hypothetical protein